MPKKKSAPSDPITNVAGVSVEKARAPKKRTRRIPARTAMNANLTRFHEEIAMLAYQLWEEGGRRHGNHEENWYRAQEEIRRRYSETETMVAGAGSR